MKTWLQLGCGGDYREDHINLDKGNCKCDVKWDVEDTPWPFEDNSMDRVMAKHLLEHIKKDKIIPFFKEIHRILIPFGLAEIWVPHYRSQIAFSDFTHINYFTEESLRYFQLDDPINQLGKIMGIDFNFDIEVSVYKEGYNSYFENRIEYYRPNPLPEHSIPQDFVTEEEEYSLRNDSLKDLAIYFKLIAIK